MSIDFIRRRGARIKGNMGLTLIKERIRDMQKVEKFVRVATIFKRCEVISDNIMLDTLLLEGRDGKE